VPALAIRVTDLAKRYRLGTREPYRSLRESLAHALRGTFARREAITASSRQDHIWALEGVSFEVAPGEVVGIIGRNGAGKTTILKLLSRITAPTRGHIELRGRVGALLEVGTGFHPELTGRENIYLSGAILGMKRAEIRRQFDAIVDFAEIEAFLDTPVKRYSSGMFVRLGFAVAAHLQPEILIVDEVLAVGDTSFQRKCVNKMEDVGHEGRTVLFVSHNMPSITRLCPRTILLDHGRVLRDGPSHEVVGEYLRSGLGTTAAREWPDPVKAPGNDVVRLQAVRVRNEHGDVAAAHDIRRGIRLEIEFDVLKCGFRLVPNLHVVNEDGAYVCVAIEVDSPWHRRERPVGHHVATAWLPGNLLAEGSYVVGAAISTMDPVRVHLFERDAVAFQVIDPGEGDSARGEYGGPIPGVVRPLLRWEARFEPALSGKRVDE
jgi:lipopolysaccharide transport system ATP-binding protein